MGEPMLLKWIAIVNVLLCSVSKERFRQVGAGALARSGDVEADEGVVERLP